MDEARLGGSELRWPLSLVEMTLDLGDVLVGHGFPRVDGMRDQTLLEVSQGR